MGDLSKKEWVTESSNGHLRFGTTSKGDRIPDFSYAGYGGGGIMIPEVPVKKPLDASHGDDTMAIQTAVDEVSEMPLRDGIRGAVLLSSGTFHCSNVITLSNDGVVLRGSGTNNDGTTIEMTGLPHVCVAVKGKVSGSKVDSSSSEPITDAYVPCGATSLTVKDASVFRAGDRIVVIRPFTKEWIHFMAMDNLVRDGNHQTWISEQGKETIERRIRSVEGNRITLDIPLADAIDAQFLTANAAMVAKIAATRRISQCGIESLRINSPPPTGDLRAANNTAVTLDGCEDCWVRNVFMQDTLSNVHVSAQARRISLEGVNAVHTATVKKGSGYSADFVLVGTQILLNRCTSSGDNSFYVATLDPSASLNAVLNCSFFGNGSIQPHMRWSTALLLDGCNLEGGRIEFINRNTAGSGHGWAMGWGVVWNCTAKELDIQQPPGAMNWCIGSIGSLNARNHATENDGLASVGMPVLPKSLYLAQLRERLGDQALKNIGY